MLALSPDQFEYSSNFRTLPHIEHSKASIPRESRLDYVVTNAGLSIRLPLLKVDQVEGVYAAFLACTDADDRVPSAILLRTTADSPSGHFWRTISNEGPIERSQRRWFQISGRDGIDTKDIYIMPRFTSVSGDNIERLWTRVDSTKQMQNEGGHPVSRRKKPFILNAEVLQNLKHVPDSSFLELNSLRQTYLMMNQHDQLFRMIRTKQLFVQTTTRLRRQHFCGRAAVLQKLKYAFFPSERDVRSQERDITSCVISGLVGIGKTQVAVEFCYMCLEKQLFDTVLWISAESLASILDGFQRFASELSLVEPGTPPETIVHEVLNLLSDLDQHPSFLSGNMNHSSKWLLVFDDVHDASLLDRFWPSKGPDCVLVTSRDAELSFKLASNDIVLEPFTAHESSELLRNLTRKEWDFTVLIERLGGLPLAIDIMGHHIFRTKVQLASFMPKPDLNTDRTLHVALDMVSSKSLNRLPTSSLAVLKVISFLDPDSIEGSILITSRAVALREFPLDEFDLSKSQGDLVSQTLISKSLDRHELRVHRPVQNFVRERMRTDRDEYQRALSTAVALLSSACIDAQLNEQSKPPHSRTHDDLLPHVGCLKGFVTEMTDSKDTYCIKTEFARLLSYVDD